MRSNAFRISLLTLSLGVLQACSTLPQREPVLPTYSTQYQTDNTQLAHLFEPLKQSHPNLTGYHVLFEPTKALATRLQLIERADQTLDLQYYIWDNDKVGALAIEAILRAADRGVKVRLLVDDNNSKNLEAVLRTLTQHPNIQVRVFNPFRFRNLRPLDMVLDFDRITRRMHNKTFIVDQEVALIGGRNMSNQYYNAGENYQFSDMDVLLVGQATDEIMNSFDEYWNHDYAYPIADLNRNRADRLSMESLRKQLEQNWFESTVEDYLGILSSSLSFDDWFNTNLPLQWVKAEVIKDSADKIKKDAPQEEHLNFQMTSYLKAPKSHVDLVSAYFIPDRQAQELIQTFAAQGVKIRVLTNSYKANDVPFVHAFYAKYREPLLAQGISLYEFLPSMPYTLSRAERKELFADQKVDKDAIDRSSLHAKFMALDNQQVFIGSFNFDPRSAHLNTEIGVILESPELATSIHQGLDQNIMNYAYKVTLNDQGKLEWQKKTENDQRITYKKEPQMSWWEKLGLKLISFLPIEGQM
uniref:phospholipase D-like domain-containing protein n=1 Tax=uncultured Acinetobacter sp. TaxID=165433 RepID=UPI002611E452|nr:phospholipase D family protein [uncultured Acinetobacter sp.]